MSKRSEIRIALEKFLRVGDGKAAASMVRDHRRRPILIPESLIDFDRIGKSGKSFLEMGRRLRILKDGLRGGEEVWVLPSELCQISRDEAAAASGIALPFGTIVHDGGLWLKWAPGYRELGVNDREDLLVRFEPESADKAAVGPVPNSVHTLVQGWSRRLVVRQAADEQAADRREAEAWLKVMALLGAGKTLKTDFKCAGIDCAHLTNDPHLHRTSRLGFYDVRDSEMLRLESLVRLRFRKARRQVPGVTVLSLTGVPHTQTEWAAFMKRVKAAKKDPVKLGLPEKLTESRFYDAASKGIVPSCFAPFSRLAKLPADLTVITVNTDWHGEIKGRGVMSPIATIMSLIEVISSGSAVAALSRSGNATCFTGPSGTGKSIAALFWSDRNEKHRRGELRRRYEADLRRTPDAGRLGEAGIQKELDKTMAAVGILCQEDGVEILKEGAGRWVFWPAFRSLYARTAGFPGLKYVLAENQPLLENAAADFGGSGDPRGLGQMNHACCTERIFYDPEWHHLNYDRTPRMDLRARPPGQEPGAGLPRPARHGPRGGGLAAPGPDPRWTLRAAVPSGRRFQRAAHPAGDRGREAGAGLRERAQGKLRGDGRGRRPARPGALREARRPGEALARQLPRGAHLHRERRGGRGALPGRPLASVRAPRAVQRMAAGHGRGVPQVHGRAIRRHLRGARRMDPSPARRPGGTEGPFRGAGPLFRPLAPPSDGL